MGKEEKRAAYIAKQRAITAADQERRGYTPPTPPAKKTQKREPRPVVGSQAWAETYRDDLGESPGLLTSGRPRPLLSNRGNKIMEHAKLNEPVLEDEYPVYGGYLYVADGEVIESDLHETTVRHLKAYLGASEIRRCDIYGRAALSKASGKGE